jgi:hypothetical protein
VCARFLFSSLLALLTPRSLPALAFFTTSALLLRPAAVDSVRGRRFFCPEGFPIYAPTIIAFRIIFTFSTLRFSFPSICVGFEIDILFDFFFLSFSPRHTTSTNRYRSFSPFFVVVS